MSFLGHTIVRLISLPIALLIMLPADSTAYAVLISFALIHFWFGFYYAWPEFSKAVHGPRRKVLIGLILLAFTGAIFYSHVVAIAFFGLHYMLSESYYGLKERPQGVGRFILARALLEGAVYFTVAFKHVIFKSEPTLTSALVALAFTFFIFEWWKARERLGGARKWDLLGTQLVTALAFVLCFYVFELPGLKGTLVLIFLHALPWVVYPIVRERFSLKSDSLRQVGWYVLATLAFMAVTVPLISSSYRALTFAWSFYSFWVYVHIIQGLVASYAVPVRVKQFFYS